MFSKKRPRGLAEPRRGESPIDQQHHQRGHRAHQRKAYARGQLEQAVIEPAERCRQRDQDGGNVERREGGGMQFHRHRSSCPRARIQWLSARLTKTNTDRRRSARARRCAASRGSPMRRGTREISTPRLARTRKRRRCMPRITASGAGAGPQRSRPSTIGAFSPSSFAASLASCSFGAETMTAAKRP